MNKQVYAIRGATTISQNTKEEIERASTELIKEIVEKNKIVNECIVSILISSTDDITATYPAKSVREYGFSDVPIFSCLEPEIDGGLPLCIRFLITAINFEPEIIVPKHIYLHGAKKLRPDLVVE